MVCQYIFFWNFYSGFIIFSIYLIWDANLLITRELVAGVRLLKQAFRIFRFKFSYWVFMSFIIINPFYLFYLVGTKIKHPISIRSQIMKIKFLNQSGSWLFATSLPPFLFTFHAIRRFWNPILWLMICWATIWTNPTFLFLIPFQDCNFHFEFYTSLFQFEFYSQNLKLNFVDDYRFKFFGSYINTGFSILIFWMVTWYVIILIN